MKFQEITSRQNPLVREAAAIRKSRKGTGLFFAEGARLCADAAESGITVLRLFFTPAAQEKYRAYLETAGAACAQCFRVSEPVAQLLSETRNSQGMFCLCREPAQAEPAFQGKILVLEQMQDPANLGTILRTAEALGIAQVLLLEKGPDPYGGKALRASMGAAFRMRPACYEDRDMLFQMLKKEGVKTFAAVPRGGGGFLQPFPERAAVFVGNEGNGLKPETVNACDGKITIPMSGRAESLNAAAAAGILMWEMMRR